MIRRLRWSCCFLRRQGSLRNWFFYNFSFFAIGAGVIFGAESALKLIGSLIGSGIVLTGTLLLFEWGFSTGVDSDVSVVLLEINVFEIAPPTMNKNKAIRGRIRNNLLFFDERNVLRRGADSSEIISFALPDIFSGIKFCSVGNF